MITFDKLKLVSDLDTFQIMNGSVFRKFIMYDEVMGLEYYENNPCLLRN